jgi:hypothetical protein
VGDILSPEAIRVQRDLVNYLMLDEDVDRVISVVPDSIEPFNRMFHYAEPKYRTIPTTTDDAYGLFTLFMIGTAPGEADVWLSLANNDACMRVLLRDHTYETLTRLQRRLSDFVTQRSRSHPAFRHLDILFLDGIAALYAAANDVLYEIDFLNITFVRAVRGELRSVHIYALDGYRHNDLHYSCYFTGYRPRSRPWNIYDIPNRRRVHQGTGSRRDNKDRAQGTGAAVLATFSVIVGGLTL